MNAMKNYADSADAPDFDAPGIVRRTRRRRTAGIATVAVVLVLAGTGTALAAMNTGEGARATVASSPAPRSGKDTVVLVENPGDTFTIDFAGRDLAVAKVLLAKARLQLGTVGKAAPEGCKPGTVIAADPHSPTPVRLGGTVNLTLCAR